MGAKRRAMDAERSLFGVVAVAINKAKAFGHSKIDLVGRQCKFTAYHAPNLDVNLRAIKRRFVWHFNVVYFRIDESLPDHVFGLFPKLRFVDEFGVVAGQARRIVSAETHDVFLDAED